MDFNKLKQKAIELKEKTIDYSTQKLVDSSFTLDNKSDIDKFIDKSQNTSFKNKETGEEKTFTKRSLLIFGKEGSDFFKKALYILPVLATKGFTQNLPVKLVKYSDKLGELSDYKISELPSLVIYENKAISKIITGEEKIIKLVKNLELDINKALEEL